MPPVRAVDLQTIREAAGLTQVEFAERLGVHPVTLSRFERGRDPITKTVDLAIYELASRLGVRELLPDVNQGKPKRSLKKPTKKT